MTITESLPHDKQGVASALNDTVRELGGAVGIAMLGSLVSAGYRSSVSDATTELAPELAHRVEEGIGSAFAATGDLGASAPTVLDAARSALVDGWQLSMWFGVVLAGAAFVYLLVRGPRPADEVAEDVLDEELFALRAGRRRPEGASDVRLVAARLGPWPTSTSCPAARPRWSPRSPARG